MPLDFTRCTAGLVIPPSYLLVVPPIQGYEEWVGRVVEESTGSVYNLCLAISDCLVYPWSDVGGDIAWEVGEICGAPGFLGNNGGSR